MIVAEKMTELPAQMLLADSTIVTEGVTNGFTVIVIWLLVVVAGQSASAVTLTVIISVLMRVAEVNELPVSPAIGLPFRYHW